MDAILWVMPTGGSWRALPDPFGPWQTLTRWYRRWRHTGIWERIPQAFFARDLPCPSSA